MRVAVLIARILLGLVFFVFGLNGLLHFLPSPPIPGLPGQFIDAMMQSHYIVVVSLVEVIGGALLLAGRCVPLGLTLLGPVVVNILLFHIFMLRQGLPIALLTAALWFVVFAGHRRAFAGIFAFRA